MNCHWLVAGMAGLDCKRVIPLSAYLNVSQYYIYGSVFGRISGKYVRRNGKIVELPDGGEMITALYWSRFYESAQAKLTYRSYFD